jgi:hypothetical protein
MFDYDRYRTFGIVFVIFLLINICPGISAAQQTGTLTGTITNPQGKPVDARSGLLATGVFVDLQEHDKARGYNPGDFRTRGIFNDVDNGRSRISSDRNMGGLYTFRNLKPGIYDLIVEEGQLPKQERGFTYYRPIRVVGIVVKAGEDTVYDITMHPGDSEDGTDDPKNNTLEMIGEPKGGSPERLTDGWVEGTVTNPDGQPVWTTQTLLVSGVVVTLKKSTGETAVLQSDHLAGGFFSAGRLWPGTYDVIIERSTHFRNRYRPLIVGRVAVKAGVRTVLKIGVSPGDDLERASSPDIAIQKVALLGKL